MYNLYEIIFLTPFTIFWILLMVNPRFALKLTGRKKDRNPTTRRIWFARTYTTLFIVAFALIFYFVDQ
jgi:hypothetical protein